MNGQPVIEVDHVTVTYGATRAVGDVTFSVAPGAVYALLGRNGAGKSSLIRAILGQFRPNHGSVRIAYGTPKPDPSAASIPRRGRSSRCSVDDPEAVILKPGT